MPATNHVIRARTVITMTTNMALAAITKPTSSADEIMKREVIAYLLSLNSFSVERSGRSRKGEKY
jgi:hypothetical protein